MQERSLEITEKARQEVEYFYQYYNSISDDLMQMFHLDLLKAVDSIQNDPKIYRIRYREMRRINLDKFPIMLVYIYTEDADMVKVLSCFHQKSNPIKFYKNI